MNILNILRELNFLIHRFNSLVYTEDINSAQLLCLPVYFEDAKTESHIARYSAIKTYTERRLEEIYENARKFAAKTSLILG